jgi:peroxiredoxin
MEIILPIAYLLLIVVFLLAGIGKLIDRAGTRQAVIDFGTPLVLVKPVAFLLPLTELVIAVSLIFVNTAWWSVMWAVGLLLIFNSVIAINLAKGRTPNCHCFGQLHSKPIGWSTFARNAGLIAIASLILWQDPTGIGLNIRWLGMLTVWQTIAMTFGILVIIALIGQGWFIFQLLQQNGRLLLRIETLEAQFAPLDNNHTNQSRQPNVGLAPGSKAPNFHLPNIQGKNVTLDDLRSQGKPVMLIFTDPECNPCTALIPEVAQWQKLHFARLTITLISRGALQDNLAKTKQYDLENVLLQKDREVGNAYKAYGTPMAIVINPNGTIESPLVGGAQAIGELVNRVAKITSKPLTVEGVNGSQRWISTSSLTKLTNLDIGQPAPRLRLPNLSGKVVNLSDFRDKQTLLLFWNPYCGFCQRMLQDVKMWESHFVSKGLKSIFISTGTVEANQEMGLRSEILLEESFNVGRLFGARGTPSAILIDSKGNIASKLATGANEISTLIAEFKKV